MVEMATRDEARLPSHGLAYTDLMDMRATTAIQRVARLNLHPHATCAFVDQFRQQELRECFGRGIAKPCALAPEQQRFDGDDWAINRIRAFVMPAVKLDADAASGDWTLDALVSRHGSLARLKILKAVQVMCLSYRAAGLACRVNLSSARQIVTLMGGAPLWRLDVVACGVLTS